MTLSIHASIDKCLKLVSWNTTFVTLIVFQKLIVTTIDCTKFADTISRSSKARRTNDSITAAILARADPILLGCLPQPKVLMLLLLPSVDTRSPDQRPHLGEDQEEHRVMEPHGEDQLPDLIIGFVQSLDREAQVLCEGNSGARVLGIVTYAWTT
jgi:hypothetical protein